MAFALTASAGLAVSADAKKKGGKSFEGSTAVNLAVLDDAASGPSVPLTSDIAIPKKFKGKVVGDVNVTLKTTGSGVSPLTDLVARLSAPNGRTVELFEDLGGINLGPLTFDDDARALLCESTTFCEDADATVLQPYVGTVSGIDGRPPVPLEKFNGIPMRGAWTLTLFDIIPGETSILNSWGLKVKPAKPVPE